MTKRNLKRMKISNETKDNIILSGNEILETAQHLLKAIARDLNSKDESLIIAASVCASVIAEYFITGNGFAQACEAQRIKLINEAISRKSVSH